MKTTEERLRFDMDNCVLNVTPEWLSHEEYMKKSRKDLDDKIFTIKPTYKNRAPSTINEQAARAGKL